MHITRLSESYLLGYNAVQSAENQAASSLLATCFVLRLGLYLIMYSRGRSTLLLKAVLLDKCAPSLILRPQDRGGMFLRNVG
jgi:hypothetical protein